MNKKIVGIFVMMLFFTATILPALVTSTETYKKQNGSNDSYVIEIEIDDKNTINTITLLDTYNIYEGQYFKLTLTGRWNPPNPTKTICLWADAGTMPTGATLTPPCNCAPGQVTSVFEWTPSVGQAGTYVITFYLGEACGVPLGSFQETIIVHPSGQDDPPLVVIQSPADGTTFNGPDITLTGYATDDVGIVSIGSHHEWTGDEAMTSGTITQTTYYTFNWDFELEIGWNRITIFVYDTESQYAEDQIVVYYEIQTNNPPNKPTRPSGSTSGKTGTSYRYESYFSDPDGDSMEILFDWGDGNDTGWIGPVASGTSVGQYHTYSLDGTYSVKTKARDIPDNDESVWSDPLSVTMPKNKVKSLDMSLISRFFESNPIISYILQILLKL